jgi:hypothetical protein
MPGGLIAILKVIAVEEEVRDISFLELLRCGT